MAETPRSSPFGAAWTQSYFQPPPVSDNQDPMLQGNGPAECSSCTELSVQPVNIWDVNGYYRNLGVGVHATRKELRQAYQAKVGGLQSGPLATRLTYVLGQLLNRSIRRAYDLTPLGELFFDRYVQDMLRRKMQERMAERMSNLAQAGVDLGNVDPEQMQADIYSEMGLEQNGPDTPGQMVDEDAPKGEDDPDRPAKFEYAFYIWRTRLGDETLARETLLLWQSLLALALSGEGISARFAVGLHGEPHRWVQGLIGYRTVFFLNTSTAPTEDLARDVARQVRKDRDSKAASALLANNPKR